MNDKINHTCCFFGHRKIDKTDELAARLYYTIENLIINSNVDTFLFGSKSQFDDLCLKIVTDLKEKHPHIKRIYVRSEFAEIDEHYTSYLLKSYEDTYYSKNVKGAGKAAYVQRNRELIDQSRFCVIYYSENYTLPKRKNSKKDLYYYQPKSGTKVAYDYAVTQKREIINII